MNILVLGSSLSEALLYALLALGVYISFRILNIADMSVDGSFATGGAICAILLVNGVTPLLAILAAVIGGAIAGLITGVLITIFEIPSILAGILTQLGLYSINLRIMGVSNLTLLKSETIFKQIHGLFEPAAKWCQTTFGINITANLLATLSVGVFVLIIIIGFLYFFFGTEMGSSIRATGNNEKMAQSLGVNTKKTKIIGLALSNALVALSGALVTQSSGYADVKMGTGVIIVALAAIVIGEVMFKTDASFLTRFISIVVGMIIYYFIRAFILELGLGTDDFKLVTSIIVGLALATPIVLEKSKQKRTYKKNVAAMKEEGKNNA